MATLKTQSSIEAPAPTRTVPGKWIVSLCLGIAIAKTGTAAAQAGATADRNSAIATFGQGTYMLPAFQQPSNFGYAAGVDLTPIFVRRLQPSLEIRATADSGSIAKEFTYSGGLKLATTIGRIRPYATILDGVGTVYFNHPSLPTRKGLYAHDSSKMLSLGGGAEFDVSRLWQLRADYSRQYWTLESPVIRPVALSIGIAYRIPFRDRNVLR
jgi:hypothetical protein